MRSAARQQDLQIVGESRQHVWISEIYMFCELSISMEMCYRKWNTWHMFLLLETSVTICAPSFRHDEDASHCAVPISTSLIKQIVHKNGNEDNLEHILADFYGPKTSTGPPWPYVAKDTDRYSIVCMSSALHFNNSRLVLLLTCLVLIIFF